MFIRFMILAILTCSCLTGEISYDFLSDYSSDNSINKIPVECAIKKRRPPPGVKPTYRILKNPKCHPSFFSALFVVIGFLEDYEKEQWPGILVDFSDQGNYYEPSMGRNWWNYYFKPLSETPKMDYEEWNVVEDRAMQYCFNTLFHTRAEVNKILEKYIRVTDEVSFEVESFAHNNFDDSPVLGVCYLGPEKKVNVTPPSFKNFYDRIDIMLQKNNFFGCMIFVSTDDAVFLEEMIERYGPRVVYRDVPRGDSTVSAVYNSRTPHFDKGFDEIVDCLLLAKCEGIVRTNSNISTAAGFFNPDLELVTIRTLAPPVKRQ